MVTTIGGIRTEKEKNGIKDVILRISFRHRLSPLLESSSFPLLHHAPRGAFFIDVELIHAPRGAFFIDVELIIRYDRSASSPFFPFFTFDRSSSSKEEHPYIVANMF